MIKSRLTFIAGLLISASTFAQQFPSQPISIVVGFTPGGSNDVLARMIAPKLTEKLKIPVYVDNKPGANGHIGLQFVQRAKPDGYTLYLGSSSPIALNPLINKNIKFSLKNDAVVVNTLAKTFQLVATGGSSPYKTLPQLIAASKGSVLISTQK